MTDHLLGGRILDTVADAAPTPWPITGTALVLDHPFVSVRRDEVTTPDGQDVSRIVVQPHDAVAVLATDEADRVLLVRQYRHAHRRKVVEIPAGVLDLAGEDALVAAQRELAEETGLVASSWRELIGFSTSVGHSTERVTIFRATGLTAAAGVDFVREAEEADMEQVWVPLDAAVEAVLAGHISDSKTALALLAVHAGERR